MKKFLTVLLIAVMTGLMTVNVDAANKKTRHTGKRNSTTATTGKTSTGINIKTFCRIDNSNPKCGRAIVLLDSAEIFSNLKAAGYKFEKVESGKMTHIHANIRYKEPTQADYYYFVGPNGQDRVFIREDGRVEIAFNKESDKDKFLNSCLKMGYMFDSADTKGDWYMDPYTCEGAGTLLTDYGSLFIWKDIVWNDIDWNKFTQF